MDSEIKEEFLSKYDYWYSVNKNEEDKAIIYREKLLASFLNKFNLKAIFDLSIDDYVVGKKEKSSFCWWVEDKLSQLGDIRGGQLCAFQRFGIYYDSKVKDYVFGSKKTKHTRFGSSKDEIYQNIRLSLISLIKDVYSKNYEGMTNNQLNPLFKNKIIYLYDHNNWIPIYSDSDLTILLTIFGIPFDKNEDRVYKRLKLFNFYKGLCRDDISTLSFMDFIYSDLGYRSSLRTEDGKKLLENCDGSEYQLVDVKSASDILRKENTDKHGMAKGETATSLLEKKMTGKKGENIVKEYLETHKKELGIVGDIFCPCEEDDYKHYDFSYVDTEGKTIYIEVKSTKIDRKDNIIFEMSQNEYEKMKENMDTYFIYYINNVYSGKIIKRIRPSLIAAKPIKYGISLNDNDDL